MDHSNLEFSAAICPGPGGVEGDEVIQVHGREEGIHVVAAWSGNIRHSPDTLLNGVEHPPSGAVQRQTHKMRATVQKGDLE